ncbi:unnamed protein product [Anisakis simplex]|uniref:Uncharacterized protein n=1 Tax=Anisakis simplex TaxID=6269 RepID=A0A0M3JDC1_ANISI|nr:unnamed protein product [Anisakis simplex]
MIDFDTPIDELTNVHTSQSPPSNVHHQNQPQQLLLSEMNPDNPLTSESLSSHDSEDSNGFIRVDEPFIDPLLSE